MRRRGEVDSEAALDEAAELKERVLMEVEQAAG